MNDMPTAAYGRAMQRRGLGEPTIAKRLSGLRLLADWIDPVPLLDATTDQIEAFLDARQIEARTRYHWISHLHAFYEWAVLNDLIDRDPTVQIIRPKLDRLLPRPISESDLILAIDGADRLMRTWLTLAAYAGLRCAEIANLQRHDVLDSDGLLRIMGKGRKERMVPMGAKVTAALTDWGLPRRGYLFTRPRCAPFPPAMVSREIAVYLETRGIDATAHQLRHRFGTRVYRSSRDIRLTQELLGHASPVTTAAYAAWDQDAAAAVIDRLD